MPFCSFLTRLLASRLASTSRKSETRRDRPPVCDRWPLLFLLIVAHSAGTPRRVAERIATVAVRARLHLTRAAYALGPSASRKGQCIWRPLRAPRGSWPPGPG